MGAKLVTNMQECDGSSEDDVSETISQPAEDSDSLDSTSSRKRRRLSFDDSDEELPLSTIPVPSRIKPGKLTPEAGKTTTTSILAPVDQNTTFDSLGLKPWLVNSLASMAIR